ncbi:Uncharacterised protein [Vibrio cholerae]|nr:Uncharacterised protein [Vibrio cholerae]CSI62631.1 Uncharacterised protein [Vibrio cholerae]
MDQTQRKHQLTLLFAPLHGLSTRIGHITDTMPVIDIIHTDRVKRSCDTKKCLP